MAGLDCELEGEEGTGKGKNDMFIDLSAPLFLLAVTFHS